jgi:hypothetical protein
LWAGGLGDSNQVATSEFRPDAMQPFDVRHPDPTHAEARRHITSPKTAPNTLGLQIKAAERLDAVD